VTAAIDRYRELSAHDRTIPLFCRPFWLDAVCGAGNWDVAIVDRGGRVVGALPYRLRSRFGFTLIEMPLLTQFMGPWLSLPAGQRNHSRLSFEKEVLTELIDQLPAFDYFRQNFHYSVTNWLPFHWKGFQQTTRYTYVLEDLSDPRALFADLRSNIKTDIKKAQKSVRVVEGDDLGKFFAVNQLTFDRQSREPPYDLALLERLDAACVEKGCRRMLFAEDAGGAVHAAIYVVWDDQSAYYLLGGGNPKLRGSGATSLLLWGAIQHAATVTRRFDFEGSMVEPIERFFRAFGAAQKPYFQITKIATRRMRLRRAVEELVGL
jgi:Acetyltransferase (GNAT) domain